MKILVCTLLIAVCAMSALAADASGKWSGTFAPEGQSPNDAYLILKQSGTSLTGSAGPDESQQWPLSNGKVDGQKITGEVTSPDGILFKVTLVLDGDKLTGEVAATQNGETTMKGKMELARVQS
jgi:hypothetical protein